MSGYDRIRRAAAGWMSEEEHVQGIRDGMNSLKAKGLLPASAEPLAQPGINFETGHYVAPVLGGESGRWTTYVTHDSDPRLRRIIQIEHGDLGGDHSRLADAVTNSLRHPEVMQSMHEQMQHGAAEEPSWFREFPA